MKPLVTFSITCIFIVIVALSLTSCQQCVHAHDVPYTYYTSHCMMYNHNGTCAVNVPIANHGYQSHCDEWKDS